MIAESAQKSFVSARFIFPSEPGSKTVELLINPLLPLMNYKGQIEHHSGINLFGKKMTFKYMTSEEEGYKVEFLQDVARKTGMNLKNQTDILILLEEAGG